MTIYADRFNPYTPANRLASIEALAKKYADAHGLLSDTVAAMNYEREQIVRNYLASIKKQVKAARAMKAELEAAIVKAPGLFEKPRTVIFHGIKVGYRKASGKLEFADADQVVKLIRKHFPEQFDVLVKTTETPVKKALANLTAAELKKLGIEVADTDDVVVIEDTTSEVDKLVAALLKDDELEEAA